SGHCEGNGCGFCCGCGIGRSGADDDVGGDEGESDEDKMVRVSSTWVVATAAVLLLEPAPGSEWARAAAGATIPADILPPLSLARVATLAVLAGQGSTKPRKGCASSAEPCFAGPVGAAAAADAGAAPMASVPDIINVGWGWRCGWSCSA
ncbi:hypothetical protein Vretifemale_16974, partial [Volvox reticuliferus]